MSAPPLQPTLANLQDALAATAAAGETLPIAPELLSAEASQAHTHTHNGDHRSSLPTSIPHPPAPPHPPTTEDPSAPAKRGPGRPRKRQRGPSGSSSFPEKPAVAYHADPELAPYPPEMLEYSSPTHDHNDGPVFLHPQQVTADEDAAVGNGETSAGGGGGAGRGGPSQACMRCHRIKRKCDALRPRCTGCEKAGVGCVFELSSAVSQFILQLKAENRAAEDRARESEDRLRQLESYMASLQGRDGLVGPAETGNERPSQ